MEKVVRDAKFGGGTAREAEAESHERLASACDDRASCFASGTRQRLTPIVAALELDSEPFFGPVRRADGVLQLYVELPYHHYLEIDSLTFKGTVGTPSARAWADAV